MGLEFSFEDLAGDEGGAEGLRVAEHLAHRAVFEFLLLRFATVAEAAGGAEHRASLLSAGRSVQLVDSVRVINQAEHLAFLPARRSRAVGSLLLCSDTSCALAKLFGFLLKEGFQVDVVSRHWLLAP